MENKIYERLYAISRSTDYASEPDEYIEIVMNTPAHNVDVSEWYPEKRYFLLREVITVDKLGIMYAESEDLITVIPWASISSLSLSKKMF